MKMCRRFGSHLTGSFFPGRDVPLPLRDLFLGYYTSIFCNATTPTFNILWLLRIALTATHGCKAFLLQVHPFLSPRAPTFLHSPSPPPSYLPEDHAGAKAAGSGSPVQTTNRQGPEGKIHLEAGGRGERRWR